MDIVRNFAKNVLGPVNKISIHIDNKTPVTYDKLDPQSTLKEVREKLSNSEEQIRIYEYMNFVGPYGIILRNQENYELLRENLQDGYILKIERPIDPNINETTHRCKLNYGIRMTEDGPKNLNEMAFEFPKDITQSVKMRKFCAEHEFKGTCTSKHENFLRKNLVAEGKISIATPSDLSFGFIISGGNQTDDTYNTQFSSEYNIRLFSKYEVEIDIKKVQPTEIFIQEVNSALESDNTINELKKVCEKFGEYIASKVKIGGRLHKIEYYNMSSMSRQISTKKSVSMNIGSNLVGSMKSCYNIVNGHNVSSSTSNGETYTHFYGGDENKFKEDNIALWQDSLDDYTTWQVIEYTDLTPIFEILNLELRRRILEAMGQKVLYSKIDSVDVVMSLSKFSYEHELSIPSKLSHIDLKECQIFASVMNATNKNKSKVFSTRIILYTSNNSASVVLHRIHKRSKKSKGFKKNNDKVFSLQIGWVIIGIPSDFKYEDCNFRIIDSKEYAPHNDHQINIYDQFQKNYSILVACTQQAPKQSTIHPTDSMLVTDVHFSCLNDSQLKACFFIYDLETEKLHKENFEGKFNDLFIHCSIISITQGNYLKLNREKKILDRFNNKSTVFYNAHKKSLWTCHEPTFVSLFHENCPDCSAGFVNLAPNYLIFNSLGNVHECLQISYFSAPLSPI
ncbi:hsp70 family protein [Gigaspora margarita]|uniref:Hsp70 family protein n=1 Tax=Gigaspora margarita TaxID=4874 RepID=A0A8H4B4L2_GIGMA|nr:hsp70 family protein [Gigaspora margarita]